MKIKNYAVVLLLLIFQYSFSQDIKDVSDDVQEVVDVKNDVIKDVKSEDESNKKTREANDEINDSKLAKDISKTSSEVEAANKGIQSTYDDTKETIIIGQEILGWGKKVSIEILDTDFDNDDVDMMLSQLINIKGVKRPKRELKKNNAVIKVKYNKGGDLLWISIPKETRDKFEPTVISDDKIIIKLKEN